MIKTLVFDSGAIISLALNSILWILDPLKHRFQGEFLITPKVRDELIDKPMKTKKFKLEAIQVNEYLSKQILEEVEEKKELIDMTERLLFYANNSFQAWGNYMKIVHEAEMESLALAKIKEAQALVVDERNTRMLVEDADTLVMILKRKLHTNIKVDRANLRKFQQMVEGVKIIRSVELVTIGHKLGLFDKYKIEKRELLDALLWGVKLNGCSVSEHEIKQVVRGV